MGPAIVVDIILEAVRNFSSCKMHFFRGDDLQISHAKHLSSLMRRVQGEA